MLKNKINYKIALFVLLAMVLAIILSVKTNICKLNYGKPIKNNKIAAKYNKRIGEKIVYDIKFGNISLGKAKFSYLPATILGDKTVGVMIFETKVVRFTDLEKIYSDEDNFLPFRVERNIYTWPISEKITEYYNQENFTLTIVKNKGKRKEELIIKREAQIHNAISLPFYIQNIAKFDIGWSMAVNLPNQQFEMKLTAIEEVKVPAGVFKAYRFESVPSKFQIWISADERKIPIKIKGLGALGYTFLMKEYNGGKGQI